MKAIHHFLLLTLFSLSATAYATDTISLGYPSYGGTGCPGGSAGVTLSPDAKSLSILFDSFIAEAGGMTGKTVDRKSCNIAIPVHVPNGLSVSVIQIDYRGFNSLVKNSYSRFLVEYFFAGSQGPRYQKDFKGPLNTDYIIDNKLGVESIIWSPCGQDVNLRVNSSMMVKTNSYNDDVFATVDSADFKAGIIYHLQIKKCN